LWRYKLNKVCNNFHTLSLNNLTNPSANVLSIVAIKYIIFNNLSHTTNIISFLPMITLWWSQLLDMSTTSLVFYLLLTFLLMLLYNSSFSNICHIYPYIFPYSLLLPATNNFLSPTPLFSTFFHVCYDTVKW